MRWIHGLAMVGLAMGLMVAGCERGGTEATAEEAEPTEEGASVLAGIEMRRLSGEPVELDEYAGQAVVVVNVASECGYTPQYEGLQALHERYAEQGLAVVGVPSGDFGGQELDTAEEIAEFCQSNYGVAFDMMDKVHVKDGPEQTELFRRLTDPAVDPTDGGEVQWNFEKFVVDREGRVIARFRSDVEPESEPMVEAIETALASG